MSLCAFPFMRKLLIQVNSPFPLVVKFKRTGGVSLTYCMVVRSLYPKSHGRTIQYVGNSHLIHKVDVPDALVA